MRNQNPRILRTIFFVVVVIATVSAGTLFQRRWKALSQGGRPIVTTYMYPYYEFNNLNGPTGLLLLKPPQGGTSYFHLFIADTGNHVIREFNPSLGFMQIVAGTVGTPGYVDGNNALFNFPTGLSGKTTSWSECSGRFRDTCIYYDYQNIYINDSQNFVVRKVCVGSPNPSNPNDCNYNVQTSSHPVTTASGKASVGYIDGANASAAFSTLAGSTAGTANSYLVDAGNHSIRAWDGTTVTTFAGNGSYGFVDGYRTSAKFNAPTKTALVAASGIMYVSDAGNNAIRKIDPQGYVTTFAGAGPTAPGKVDGPGGSARFFRPTSVINNPVDGYIYVADSHNNCIRRIDASGNVTTYAGTGEPGLVNGPRLQAKFSMPMDLVIYNGVMYVSDNQNNVIRAIDMVYGNVSTFIS